MNSKPFLLLMLVLFFASNLNAQYDLGVKLNVGISRITNSFEPHNGSTTYRNRFPPSFQSGLCYLGHISERSKVGAELLFVQIEGCESGEGELIGSDGGTGYSKTVVRKHISYVSMPVYYGFLWGKFQLNAGLQASFALFSRGSSRVSGEYKGESFDQRNTYDELNIDRYDFGARVGFAVHVSERWVINANFYQGLHNIPANPFETWRTQQLTAGVKYLFYHDRPDK